MLTKKSKSWCFGFQTASYNIHKDTVNKQQICVSVCVCVCVCPLVWDPPDMTSSSSMSLRPFLKSSSMFSICVPAFLKWELHQAVKVWERGEREGFALSPSDWTTQTLTHTDSEYHNFTCYTHTNTHTRAAWCFPFESRSKLLHKAWTVHFNLWCCLCGCWRTETFVSVWRLLLTQHLWNKLKLTSALHFHLVRKSFLAFGND